MMPPGPPFFRNLLVLAATAYFLLILLNVTRKRWVYDRVPAIPRYFSQVADLFAASKINDVEYRAEGWFCRDGAYRELDTRPFFPIHAANKENRFSRAMHFYRGNGRVLESLASYIMREHNIRAPAPDGAGGGEAFEYIGGVRLWAVLTPVPLPAEGAKRYRYIPLAESPWERRKLWYEPSSKALWKRCRERP